MLAPDETPLPRSGDVLHITREASVQFTTPIYFRVIRVHDWPTYTGWVWLDGYQLNAAGDAVERRSIFVQVDRLRRVPGPPGSRTARNGQPPAPSPRGGQTPPGPSPRGGQTPPPQRTGQAHPRSGPPAPHAGHLPSRTGPLPGDPDQPGGPPPRDGLPARDGLPSQRRRRQPQPRSQPPHPPSRPPSSQ